MVLRGFIVLAFLIYSVDADETDYYSSGAGETEKISISAQQLLEESFLTDFDDNFYKDEDHTISRITKTRQDSSNEPKDCSSYTTSPYQPVYDDNSKIKKCCPIGQNYHVLKNGKRTCRNETKSFVVETIAATFYKHCIEDEEKVLSLSIEEGNPCEEQDIGSLLFNEHFNDTLYVVQNGTLLRINSEIFQYDLFTNYCLDMDAVEGILTAYVCQDMFINGQLRKINVKTAKSVIFGLFVLIAIPLLLATAILYYVIPEFSDINGKALSCNCLCYATALVLKCVYRFQSKPVQLEKYVEYLVLATFCWLLVTCVNICIHTWYFLPKGKVMEFKNEMRILVIYTTAAMGSPFIFFLLNLNQDEEALRHNFFRLLLIIMFLIIVCFVITILGFIQVKNIVSQLKQITENIEKAGDDYLNLLPQLPQIRTNDILRVRNMNIYTGMLFIVMGAVWVITTITFYKVHKIPITFDILFGLQGILIFLIFVCLPKPRRIVKAWFKRTSFLKRHQTNNDQMINDQPLQEIETSNLNNGTETQEINGQFDK